MRKFFSSGQKSSASDSSEPEFESVQRAAISREYANFSRLSDLDEPHAGELATAARN